jgi:hypothetical protein
MITGPRYHFEARCRERGYDLATAMQSVVEIQGDMYVVDETHPDYPRERQPVAAGPGTELKALLRYIGIVATPNCTCNARALEMDIREAETPGWCAENIETILDWLKEQADARGLPFLRMGAKVLVRRAISNARKKAAQQDNNK